MLTEQEIRKKIKAVEEANSFFEIDNSLYAIFSGTISEIRQTYTDMVLATLYRVIEEPFVRLADRKKDISKKKKTD